MRKTRQTSILAAVVLVCASMAWAGVDAVGTVEGTVKGISGLENALIYVEDAPGEAASDVRYAIDQVDKVFLPYVLPVPAGEEVVFVNSDPILHNVHSYDGKKTIFNWGMPLQGFEMKKRFEDPGDVLVLCDVHPEMEAWIKVLPTPYYTAANEDGTFTLEGVPVGEYTVTAWHPRAKKPQSLTVSITANGVAQAEFKLKK